MIYHDEYIVESFSTMTKQSYDILYKLVYIFCKGGSKRQRNEIYVPVAVFSKGLSYPVGDKCVSTFGLSAK